MSFPRKIPPLSPGNIGALSVEEIHQVFYDLHVHQVEMEMQKVESIGSLAKGIAHDLNNILFPISGRSEMLLDDTPLYTPELNSIEQSINPHNGAVIWSSRSCLSDLPINPIG
jgi:signal transduction histidine kinase